MSVLGSLVLKVATGGLQDAAGAAGEILSVKNAVDQLNRSIEDLGALDGLAKQTGASVENLGRLQQVARAFDHDFSSVGAALQNLALGMAGIGNDAGKTDAALRTLGVSAVDAAGQLRDPSVVMIEVAGALQQYRDGGEKAALVMDLFRQSNAALVPFLDDTASSVDRFSGRSIQAIADAALFQEQLGMLRNGAREFGTDIAVAVLPAMNDLLGAFRDTGGAGVDLARLDVAGWADSAAVGFARVVDVARLLPRILSAVGGSFQAVGADIQFFGTVAEYANPIGAIKAKLQGSSANDEIRKALAQRNKVVEDANREWEDLWNKPANGMEQDVLRRIAARDKAVAAALSPDARPAAPRSDSNGASARERAAAALAERAEVLRRLTSQGKGGDLAPRASQAGAGPQAAEATPLLAVKLPPIEGLDEAKKGLEELNAFLDPAKAATFGEALKGSLGGAGDAAMKLTDAMLGFGKRQDEIAKQRGNADKAFKAGLIDQGTYQKTLTELNARDTKSRLSGYGDMASAAAGFFGEQSKGYQALMMVSKVFHAAELASTLAELVPKGIAAVLNQASGDPYSAIPRMAAMAAIVAGLGVAIGGIGGGSEDTTAKDRQKAQGTGTVLGDAEAKSNSIANSLKLIEQHADLELSHTAGMLASLRAIESSLSGLGGLLVRSAGVTGELAEDRIGSAQRRFDSIFGGGSLGEKLTGGLAGKVVGAIFGGKVTTIDTGITIGRTALGDARTGGVVSSQYADTKKDGGWFHSDKYGTKLTALGAEADAQFGRVIASLADGIGAAANLLGIGGDAFTKHLNSFVVDIGKVSLKGMSGEQIQKELEAVFSKLGDDMAKFSVAGLDQFQKVGEGYFETVVRIASDYANLDSIMQSIGREFGAVGLQSIAARERLIDLAGGIEKLSSQTSGFADNYLTEAERLAPVQRYVTEQLGVMGLAGITSRAQFKELVLGLDTTTEAGARQYAALMALQGAFAQVYPAMNESANAAEVLADRQKLEAQIYDMSHTAAEALARQRAAELAAMDESLRPLQQRIYALQDEQSAAEAAAAALEKTRTALKANVDGALAALQKSVQAEKDGITKAYQESMTGLQKRIDGLNASIGELTTLSDALHGAVDGMQATADARDTRMRAQAQVSVALAIAKAGGPLPKAAALQNALGVLGQDASSQFSSYLDYQRDLYRTANDLSALSRLTDSQLSAEQRMLAALEEQKEVAERTYQGQMAYLDDIAKKAQLQVDELYGLNTNTLTLAAALDALGKAIGAMASAPATPASPSGPTVTDLYRTVLGRDPESAGLAYWTAQFGASIDPAEVATFVQAAQPELHASAVRPSVRMAAAPAAGVDGTALAGELQRLREEVSLLRAPLELTAANTNTSANVLRRVSRDGQAFAMQDSLEEA
jgi:hypothetical protein